MRCSSTAAAAWWGGSRAWASTGGSAPCASTRGRARSRNWSSPASCSAPPDPPVHPPRRDPTRSPRQLPMDEASGLRTASGEPSGHVDPFCREALPPRELWPEMSYAALPELTYPPRLNCAVELLDAQVARGAGDRTAIHFPGGRRSYRELLETSNRVAHVLVDDLGLVAGNRVLLRAPNTPMLAACWLAVLKAGGVVVCTMPLLRTRELCYIADKAQIRLALTDHRFAADCEQAMSRHAGGAERAGARVVQFPPHFGHREGTGPQELGRLMAGKPSRFEARDTAAADVALIAFTSGTTGQGKGTMHFHRDVLAACDCFPRHVLQPEPDDIFCGSPPLAFTYGLGRLLIFPLRAGASTLLHEQATPPHLLKG